MCVCVCVCARVCARGQGRRGAHVIALVVVIFINCCTMLHFLAALQNKLAQMPTTGVKPVGSTARSVA